MMRVAHVKWDRAHCIPHADPVLFGNERRHNTYAMLKVRPLRPCGSYLLMQPADLARDEASGAAVW